MKSTALPLSFLFVCLPLLAQNNQPTEVYFQNGSTTVATVDTAGNISTQTGLFAGNTSTASGQIDFLGTGSGGGANNRGAVRVPVRKHSHQSDLDPAARSTS